MDSNASIVAFILVKSTSQRLPKKNFLEIDGVPLWLRTTKLALAELLIKHTVIVAEDEWGFETMQHELFKLDRTDFDRTTLIVRPPELCTPETTSEAVLLWAADIVDTLLEYEHILLLQATSPLLTSSFLQGILGHYSTHQLNNLVTVDPAIMREDGQVYLINRKLFRTEKKLMTDQLWVCNSLGQRWGTIDIDFEEQYFIAKALIEGRSC
ncbi:MAG: hypothetical protein UY48_C0011G0031 [Candidatus Gottesmanbacteria bacterium GW2011_GWB1_49_7]|uniref:Acylneuraminate cytidylyltransferase n=1 Tax=Candidatus Gottesmanbacteria bacterium GW2011_GWB1_49_7 TaxID=1618448 RepID=A0A0G1Z1K3_9BACT|nr:MAG: hypothetical protein UY48_C0011G0031 [Candidatus Gottesmanbacteria bacterium GW2011_GWB1_49_7]